MALPSLPPEIERLMPKPTPADFNTPLDASTLQGRSVLITGGANGIGLACAEKFATHGALVTIADLQHEAGETVAKELSSKGHQIHFVQCDVADYESQVAAFKSAIRFGGGSIDIVVPNAGVIAQKNLFDMAAVGEPSLDTTPPEPGFSGADINLKGVYYSCYLALHYFRLPANASPPPGAISFKKAIVLIASVAGYYGYSHSTTYSLSKFGVRGIFYGIRDRGLKEDVRINLVAPWFVKTQMTTTLMNPAAAASLSRFKNAPIEFVVDAVVRFGADTKLTGKSAGIFSEGIFDLGDNIWEGLGGIVASEKLAQELRQPLLAEAEKQEAPKQ